MRYLGFGSERKMQFALVALSALLHFVGFWGLVHPEWKVLFQKLVPFNLLVSFVLCYYLALGRDFSLLIAFISLAAIAFGIEVIGVATGFPFGTYSYGNAFGPKVMEVPLIIGLNWVVLSVCAMAVARSYAKGVYSSAGIAALLMTSIDYLMEHICHQLDFWYWASEAPPWQNFLAWFVIGFFLSAFIGKKVTAFLNKKGLVLLFYLQVVFFLALVIKFGPRA